MNDNRNRIIRRGLRGRAIGRNNGITLIELGFVVAIIAIIVVAVLAIYNTVKTSQEVTEVTQDVAAIRQAVAQWSGGGPLVPRDAEGGNQEVTTIGIDARLEKWSQLHPFLPGDLGKLAEGTGGDGETLSMVNNWTDSTYTFKVDIENNPYLWELTITEAPDNATAQTLGMRLEEGAEKTVVETKTITARYRL